MRSCSRSLGLGAVGLGGVRTHGAGSLGFRPSTLGTCAQRLPINVPSRETTRSCSEIASPASCLKSVAVEWLAGWLRRSALAPANDTRRQTRRSVVRSTGGSVRRSKHQHGSMAGIKLQGYSFDSCPRGESGRPLASPSTRMDRSSGGITLEAASQQKVLARL